MVRVAINGFGRTGRSFIRAARGSRSDLRVVAINDLSGPERMANLLRHDSVFGPFDGEVELTPTGLAIDGEPVELLAEPEPADLPWKQLDVDVVLESTGRFTSRDQAAGHLAAGAGRVVVSAPCKEADATFIIGVNEETFDPDQHQVISNGSCTTNCFVPMVKVLDDAFGVEKGLMTTVHAYTGDQNLVDGPHKDDRRARGAAINIVPTSTGAARATALVLEAMQHRLDGTALRVPVSDGSIVDFVAVLGRDVTVDEVNGAFRAAASEGRLEAILDYSEEPMVSSDIIGSRASCIFDAPLTIALGNLVKVFGWYDNEFGYACRLVDLIGVVSGRSG
jgi:glyceraldehyde 3-phosphate dehydrogenase